MRKIPPYTLRLFHSKDNFLLFLRTVKKVTDPCGETYSSKILMDLKQEMEELTHYYQSNPHKVKEINYFVPILDQRINEAIERENNSLVNIYTKVWTC